MISPRTPATLALLTLLAACGSQIGVEEEFTCTLVSSTVVTDRTVVQDGMAESPADAIASLVGTFDGDQLDEEETSIGKSAGLVVTDPSGDVTYSTFEAVLPDGTAPDQTDAAPLCEPSYTFDLEFELTAEDLPDFSDTIEVIYRYDNAWAATEDRSGFDEDIPEPSTFSAEDFDHSGSELVLSGGASAWAATLSWYAYDDADVYPDGDIAMTREYLLLSQMSESTE